MCAIGQVIGSALVAILLTGSVAAQDSALETRVGEKGFESPSASLAQMDWLVGQWRGEGIGGAPAMESWLPPMGGTMVGTFVQETETGEIMFTEHLYMMEEEGSLVLKLKHFNADLTGWEEKDDMLTFRLVGIEECAAYFNALTLRCADPERPGEGLVAAVRMKSEGHGVKELIFRFRPPFTPKYISYGCDGTTIEINDCLAGIRQRAEEREELYFETAMGEAGFSDTGESELHSLMRASQAAAQQHREKECYAVYEQWKEGTIRNAMSLRCSIRLIDQRTHTIWRNWLTYQDTSAPILPEPGPSM
ncbi:DUF6265 family protein [Erythrobacter sp. YT30]|uniref:DUF6265 family protein n=1 Tax=Erythrobacter sp. YT30 TaxID=1735012 RepID=UPI000A7DC33E|nr:DUF6265 family protein [Erythrobacter sp. YT30]